MKKVLRKRNLGKCILVLILVSAVFVLAGDVIVQEGDLTIAGDIYCGEYLEVLGDIYGDGYLEVSGNISGGALDVDGDIYGGGALDVLDVYTNDLDVGSNANIEYLEVDGDIYNGGYLEVSGDASFDSDVYIYGKLTAYGGHEPPYVLYDRQTRQQIIDRVKAEIPPEKQGGAALFFNEGTKTLEIYVPSEGKFYDLQGNLLYSMPAVQVATNYKTVYHLDSRTGEVKATQKLVHDRYVIKKGFRLDRETGHFINRASGDIVPKEMAVELQKGL